MSLIQFFLFTGIKVSDFSILSRLKDVRILNSDSEFFNFEAFRKLAQEMEDGG